MVLEGLIYDFTMQVFKLFGQMNMIQQYGKLFKLTFLILFWIKEVLLIFPFLTSQTLFELSDDLLVRVGVKLELEEE